MLRQHDLEDLVERLERDGEYLVLRKLKICEGHTAVPYDGGATFIGAVIDVETTGLEPDADAVIEFALRRFRFDAEGRILSIDRVWSWLEDPGRPLGARITQLTGLTDAGLAGQQIDDGTALRLLGSTNLIIAHNAAFDRKFVERRLPGVAGSAWACTCSEIDWVAAGFDGMKLGWLVAQCGLFYDAHRASNDVDAVIALLSHERSDGRSLLSELVERSSAPTMRIEAVGADFSVKENLRFRGYRWDANSKVWWKEVLAAELPEEQGWLGRHVYGPGQRSGAFGPRIVEISARERYV